MYVWAFNAIEVVIWSAMAAVIAWRYRTAARSTRRLARWAALWLSLFALSDVIEFYTGAWWRPPALLALKAACVLGLAGCGWLARRKSARAPETAEPLPSANHPPIDGIESRK